MPDYEDVDDTETTEEEFDHSIVSALPAKVYTSREEYIAAMKPVRPVAHISRDLATAEAYRKQYQQRPSDDPLVLMMREANEQEIRVLELEKEQAIAREQAMASED